MKLHYKEGIKKGGFTWSNIALCGEDVLRTTSKKDEVNCPVCKMLLDILERLTKLETK